MTDRPCLPPNMGGDCGRLKMERVVLLAVLSPALQSFFPIRGQSLSWGQFGSCRLFPCFVCLLAVLGLGPPNSPFVLFDSQNGPFYTPKTLRLKSKISNADVKATKRLSVAPPAEPRGEKKLFFVQILGGEKLLKFGEKWAVKNF